MADHGADGEILAAGALLWRPSGPGAQVALIHRPKYDDWGFAKGKLTQGEHVLLAAVREVEEETGLRVTLGRNLPPVRYPVDGLPKRVDYWAALVDQASAAFVPNSEVDKLEWVPASAASRRLSYGHDVELLAAFTAGPRRTAPLILIRHASAGSKSDWHKGDDSRPLDARGRQQAKMLARLLRCFGAARVLSSPTERCMATVRPFAESEGAEVDQVDAFAVSGHGRKKGANQAAGEPRAHDAARTVASAAADGRPAVICAHRENMPLLLEAACRQLGAEPPSGPPLRKAEFWVLHRADGKLVAAERHHPDGDGEDLLAVTRYPAVSGSAVAGCQSRVGGSDPSRMSSHRLTSSPAPPL
jgi:8-oxo-(d)GTP phosphatase